MHFHLIISCFFIFSPNASIELPEGFEPRGYKTSMNESGQIAGTMKETRINGTGVYHPAIWDPQKGIIRPESELGEGFSSGINSEGIVAVAIGNNSDYRTYYWDPLNKITIRGPNGYPQFIKSNHNIIIRDKTKLIEWNPFENIVSQMDGTIITGSGDVVQVAFNNGEELISINADNSILYRNNGDYYLLKDNNHHLINMAVQGMPFLNDLNEVIFLSGKKLYLWRSNFDVNEVDLSDSPAHLYAFSNSGKVLLLSSGKFKLLDLKNN